MKRRSKARIWALQIIYTWEVIGGELLDLAEEHLDRRHAGLKGREYTITLLSTIHEKLETIDEIIEGKLTSWPIERLSIVDKNILRIGTCELLYFNEIPRAVVIDEAVKLATRYGGTDSSKFINGILDSIPESGVNDECTTD